MFLGITIPVLYLIVFGLLWKLHEEYVDEETYNDYWEYPYILIPALWPVTLPVAAGWFLAKNILERLKEEGEDEVPETS